MGNGPKLFIGLDINRSHELVVTKTSFANRKNVAIFLVDGEDQMGTLFGNFENPQ